MLCKNCGEEVTCNFCSNCGQKSEIHRVNAHYVFSEIPNSLLQLNRGFLFTAKELFVRPGHHIREFLEGKRKNSYKPISYLLLTSTLYVLTSLLLEKNTFLSDIVTGFKSGIEESKDVSDTYILDWMTDNQIYLPFLILPLYSLATYVVYIKSKFNYFEHLVISFYITGHQILFYFIFTLIVWLDNLVLLTPITLGIIFNYWAFNQFFSEKSTFKNFILVSLSYFIFLIITGIILFCLTIIFRVW